MYNLLVQTDTGTQQELSLQQAFHRLKIRRSSVTISYFIKNYLLLLNSINASLGPQKKRFKNSRKTEQTFALGYFEDIYSDKIYYLEGNKGSRFLTAIELEKSDDRYDLYNIVVRNDKGVQLEAEQFLIYLKKLTQDLSQIIQDNN